MWWNEDLAWNKLDLQLWDFEGLTAATIMISIFCNLAPHALVNSIVFGIACSFHIQATIENGGRGCSSVADCLPDCMAQPDSGFSWFSSIPLGKTRIQYLNLCHDYLFPHPFKSNSSSIHLMLYSLSYWAESLNKLQTTMMNAAFCSPA
jgi:hypothetical protein